jgi:hypothetical protein
LNGCGTLRLPSPLQIVFANQPLDSFAINRSDGVVVTRQEADMSTKDPRIDAYIEKKAADFAKPILKKLRALVHKGSPDLLGLTGKQSPSAIGVICLVQVRA